MSENIYQISPEPSGIGSFAKVYLGTRNRDGKNVAVKIVNKTARREQSLNECISCTHIASHSLKNIVKIFDIISCPSSGTFHIIMEPLHGGELFNRIVEAGKFSEREAARIMRDILVGLHELHSKARVLHCDIKPENIVFVDRSINSELRIIDFGLSIICLDGNGNVESGVNLMEISGTPGYLAPEILMRRHYSVKSDVWSAGVILYSLLSGSLPFNVEDENHKSLVCAGRYYPLESQYWSHVSEDAKDLVRSLLEVDPDKRITCVEALSHKWIANYTTCVSDIDFGPDYVERISRIRNRQRFRKVVNGIIWSNRVRKAALSVIMTSEGSDSAIQASSPEHTPSKFKTLLSSKYSKISPMPVDGNDIKYVLSNLEFHTLKEKFVKKALKGASSVDIEDVSFEVKSHSFEKCLDEGINFEAFCEVCVDVDLGMLADMKVFELFDCDKNGKVDYREFLITLASFRQFSSDSLRVYFDLFDIDSNGSLSLTELQYLLGSILAQADENNICIDGSNSTSTCSTSSSKSSIFSNDGCSDRAKVSPGCENSTSSPAIDVVTMFMQMDINSDGHVSYEEFSNWMTNNMHVLGRFLGISVR